ncbi:MAG: outer membrane beta-barrel protein [Saprospiraceae bacterium]
MRYFLRSLFFLLFIIAFLPLQAQENKNASTGKISGHIIDATSNQPIEYATITLFTQDSNKVVNGAIAGQYGLFKITEVPAGNYKLQLTFIGYQTKEIPNVSIDKSNSNLQLGNIAMSIEELNLKEVTVTATKSIIENKIDKMIYNVDQDVTSQTGVAIDVLKKVPQVSVDVDGNVELQGNSGIRFLINGKPSVIFGSNIVEVLQSIPASQIQTIEIITSPGAKYAASGPGGIINIILKKSTIEGISGDVSLSGGSRLENGSINLNGHHKHFSANVFFSGNAQLPSNTLNSSRRITEDPFNGQSTLLTQEGISLFHRDGFQSGIGLDWDITSLDNLSASFGYDYFENNNSGGYTRNFVVKDSLGQEVDNSYDLVNNESLFHSPSTEWNVGYRRKFKKEDEELEISYTSSEGNNYSHYLQKQQYMTPDSVYSGSKGDNPGKEKESELSVDFTYPLSGEISIETGINGVFAPIESKTDVYILNPEFSDYIFSSSQSLSLKYKSNVYAAYLSTSYKLFKWLDAKTGLRYEYTDPQAFFSNSGDVEIKSYDTYVPSAIISHSFKKNNSLKLSYSYRIERPEYRDLNPFVNASDPKNLTTGNIGLKPEIGVKFELSYNKFFEKGPMINATLFYRGNKDDIQSFTKYYDSFMVGDSTYANVSVSARENLGRENNFGLNIFSSIPFTSKINFRTNLSFYQRYIINGVLPGNNVQGFNYRINANGSYQVNPTFVIELFGNFNSPRVNAQGTMPAFITYNFALRKQFFNKKASIAVTATNPFNKYVNQVTRLNGENFSLTNNRRLPYRSFGINVMFKFGKIEFNKEKDHEDINLTNSPSDNQK